ncbi:hypothetical protein HAX54_050406, partial [Datura stramonium]|nr:hypothetical protein [Datura stramonium]
GFLHGLGQLLQQEPSLSSTRTIVEFDKNVAISGGNSSSIEPSHSKNFTDVNLGFGERTISAAGATAVSAILVSPLVGRWWLRRWWWI